MKAKHNKYLFGIALFLFVLLSSFSIYGGEKPKLRVGLPAYSNMEDHPEKTALFEYTCAYLQKLSQYTDWEFTCVPISWKEESSDSKLSDMLQNGELDLLGGFSAEQYTANTLPYSLSYGSTHLLLCAWKDNAPVTPFNFSFSKNIRIAVPDSYAIHTEKLENFLTIMNTSAVYLPYPSMTDAENALKNGEADLLFTSAGEKTKNLKTVAKFAPEPVFLAVLKEKETLLAELNEAILSMEQADPFFPVEIYQKYLEENTSTPPLTEDEKAYIQTHPLLRVAVTSNNAPFQYRNKKGDFCGITADFLQYISSETGFLFEYVQAETLEEYRQLLLSGKADITLGIPENSKAAEQSYAVLSVPYGYLQYSLVANEAADMTVLSDKRLALSKGSIYSENLSKQVKQIQEYKDVQACLTAIDKGEADFTYVSSYILQYYTTNLQYQNLSPIHMDFFQKLCIGFAKPVDITLLSIMNKVIRQMPEEKMQEIIAKNISKSEQLSLAAFIRFNPKLLLEICLFLLCMILLTALCISSFHKKLKTALMLEQKKYQCLSSLCTDCLFEYEYQTDRLILLSKSPSLWTKEFCNLSQYFKSEKPAVRAFPEFIASKENATKDLYCNIGDNCNIWLRVTISIVRNASGEAVYCIGRFVDIQNEIKEQETCLDNAQRDLLTGLYNADASRQLVNIALSSHISGALFLIDINQIEEISKNHGHYNCDKIITGIAFLLEGLFRKDDIVGRINKNRFLVFMKNVKDYEILSMKCQRLKEKVMQSSFGELHIPVSFTIGVTLGQTPSTFESLYKKAEHALETAGNCGENHFYIL